MSEEKSNPYESPRPSSKFTDSYQSELEARVAELERRISQSWFLRPNIFARIFAVWGHFLLGYVIVALMFGPIIWLLQWLFT